MYRLCKSLAALAGLGSPIHHFARVIQYPPVALSILLLALLATPGVALGERDLGGCTTSVEQGTLLVIGNEIANVIEIVGAEGEGGVRVTCNGSSDTFDHIDTITVEAGDGNDEIRSDNSNGLLSGIAKRIFGQDGEDSYQWTVPLLPMIEQDGLYDGGAGNDTIQILTGLRADRFDITSGPQANSVQVKVTDIATETRFAQITGSGVELLTVKMGEGNDQAIISQVAGIALSILGQGGDDTLTEILSPTFPTGLPLLALLDLGLGNDKFFLVGATHSEIYAINGVPDEEIPDPEIRVTNLVTGEVTADFHVQQTEEIMLEAEDGDDRVEVNWDAALMSGLSFIRADLGRGNDMFVSNLLPVLIEPPTHEVQTARFQLDTGRGNDQVTFYHSAGSWFDVFFTVDLGLGMDTVNALLEPPPDDGLPGPEGLRQIQFNVFAGANDDFVRLQNRTNGDLSDVSLYSEMGGGNDAFEGIGEIHDANISPGRGSDTARVTRNFLPFVTAFENLEVLEGSP
jgi:hypothetical protein